MRSAPLAVILLAGTLPAAACSLPATRSDRQANRAEARALDELTRAVEAFWSALRWQDAATAAAFIEEDALRTAWLAARGRDDAPRFRNARLLHASVERVEEPGPDGRRWTGTAIVQVDVYALPAQVLHREVIEQRWYRTETGWYTELDPEGIP